MSTPAVRFRIEVVLLLTAAALIWRNAFDGAFQFDDFASIVQEPAYRGLRTFFADLPQRIRPTTRLSLFLDCWLFGLSPAGFHLQSVLLHAGSGLLLYGIVRRAHFYQQVDTGVAARRLVLSTACGAALLFLVHPLACESVTYVSGRASALSAFLVLLALWLHIRATPSALDGPGGQAARFAPLAFAASLACFALALGAKETAAIFPLLLLVFDAFRCSAGGRIGLATWARARWLRYHAPYWAVLAGAVLVAAASVPRYRELASFSLTLRSPWESLFVQAKALTFGLSLFVRPAQLNVDHDLAAASFDDPLAWTAGAGILALCAAALFAARRMPLASLGIVWFFVAALPANGPIARLDLLSERNLYLPMAGLALTAAALYSALHSALCEALPLRALPAARRVLALCALCVIAVLGWATVERNALWADPVALWSDAVAKSPRKSRAHDNLGYALEMRGELEGAMREYRHALELEPTNMRAWKNLRRVWDATARD